MPAVWPRTVNRASTGGAELALLLVRRFGTQALIEGIARRRLDAVGRQGVGGQPVERVPGAPRVPESQMRPVPLRVTGDDLAQSEEIIHFGRLPRRVALAGLQQR